MDENEILRADLADAHARIEELTKALAAVNATNAQLGRENSELRSTLLAAWCSADGWHDEAHGDTLSEPWVPDAKRLLNRPRP